MQVLEFLRQVIRVIFSRAFFLIDLIGLGLIFTSVQLQNVPIWIGGVFLLMIAFSATYRVWAEERNRRQKSEEKLATHLDRVPFYTVEARVVKRFSVQTKIDKYENEMNILKEKLDHAIRIIEKEDPPLNFWEQATAHLNVVTKVLNGDESTQDRYDNLSAHVSALRKFEDKLKFTYQVQFSITASRTDDGLVAKISLPREVGNIILEDDYIENNLPQFKHSGLILYPTPSNTPIPISFDKYSSVTNNIIETDLGHMNSDQSRDFPNSDLYIVTNKSLKLVSLDVELYSTNLPRRIRQKIELSLED